MIPVTAFLAGMSGHALRKTAQAIAAIAGTCVLLAAQPAFADDYADVTRLLRSGQPADAMTKIDAFLEKHPRDMQMRFIKGVVLTEQGKTGDAITVFTRLTEDHPDLPEPYNNLAVLFAASGQYDKARAALDMAIRTNPSYATAYENLGDVHAKLASQAYDKALQLDSSNSAAKSKLTLLKTLAVNTAAKGGSGNAQPAVASAATAAAPSPASAASKPAAAAAPAPVVIAKAEPPKAPVVVAKAEPVKPVVVPKPEVKAEPKPEAKAEPKLEAKPAPVVVAKAKPDANANTNLAAAGSAPAAKTPLKPAPAPVPAAASNAEHDDVLAAVHDWASAWSAQDVKRYLSHYGNDFETPKGEPRKIWADERTVRITGKGRINVKVDAPQISVNGNQATVKFRQVYSSDRLQADSRKTLVLTRQGGKWQIKQERSGA